MKKITENWKRLKLKLPTLVCDEFYKNYSGTCAIRLHNYNKKEIICPKSAFLFICDDFITV